MRSYLLPFVMLGCFLHSEAVAQVKLSQKELKQKLKKYGIDLRPSSSFGVAPNSQDAFIQPVDQDILRGLDLLRQADNLAVIGIGTADGKLMTACVERLGDFPKLTLLHLHSVLGEQDVKRIANLKTVESLHIECPRFSEAQIKSVSEMKSLKFLFITAHEFPPKAAEVLRAAKLDSFHLQQIPAILKTPPLKIADTDTPLAKVQKTKVNLALKGVKLFCSDRPDSSGAFRLWDPQAVELMRQLRAALLELDDPVLTERIVQDYVQLTEIASRAREMQFEREPFERPLQKEEIARGLVMELLYLDAQILQIKLNRKKAEP